MGHLRKLIGQELVKGHQVALQLARLRATEIGGIATPGIEANAVDIGESVLHGVIRLDVAILSARQGRGQIDTCADAAGAMRSPQHLQIIALVLVLPGPRACLSCLPPQACHSCPIAHEHQRAAQQDRGHLINGQADLALRRYAAA